jgi:hypothetical protein
MTKADELTKELARIQKNYLCDLESMTERAALEIYLASTKIAIDNAINTLPPTANPTIVRPKPCPEAAALDKIVYMCETYLDEVEEGSNNDDSEQYLVEDLMNYIYGGPRIWTWINRTNSNSQP